MPRFVSPLQLAVPYLLIVVALSGCSRGGKSLVVASQLVPDEVAQKAMELHDANGDGKIDAQELKQAPALAAALARIDANKDRAISADEIAARIRAYQSQSDLLPVAVHLQQGNRPVSEAQVVFEPAAFMGENLPSYRGQSDADGNLTLAPEGIDPLPGLPLGMYLVRITGPVEAERGCEVAEDTPTGGRVTLSL